MRPLLLDCWAARALQLDRRTKVAVVWGFRRWMSKAKSRFCAMLTNRIRLNIRAEQMPRRN